MVKTLVSIFLAFLASAALAGPSDVAYPQGALWHLRETNRYEEAQVLEDRLSTILKTSAAKHVYVLNFGVSESYLIEFDNNIFAIAKRADPKVPDSPKHEVGAYLLDRELSLNTVPLTVNRTIDGEEISLQIYYPALREEDIPPEYVHNPKEFSEAWNKIEFLDGLTVNRDRDDEHNLHQGKDFRLVAIDNARAFIDGAPDETSQVFKQNRIAELPGQIRLHISQLDLVRLKRTLEKYVNERPLRTLLQKLEGIRRGLDVTKFEVKSQAILPKAIPPSFSAPPEIAQFVKMAKEYGNSHSKDGLDAAKMLKLLGSARFRCETLFTDP